MKSIKFSIPNISNNDIKLVKNERCNLVGCLAPSKVEDLKSLLYFL